MEFEYECENCGRKIVIVLSEDNAEKYRDFLNNKITLSEALNEVDPIERDMILYHLCDSCLHS